MSPFPLRSVLHTLWLTVLLVPLCISSGHTAMGYVPLESLVQSADIILQGRVETVSSQTERLQTDRVPGQYTESVISRIAVLSAARVLKGQPDTDPVRIVFHAFAGNPDYKPGEEVIVFLRSAGEGSYTTLGMQQGKYLITDNWIPREGVTLDAFIDRVNAVINQ